MCVSFYCFKHNIIVIYDFESTNEIKPHPLIWNA